MSDDTYQIEMLWDCPAGHNRNRGRFKTCEACGRPKTESEEFYMPDDTSRQASVTDSKLLSYALGGEDWHCRYCNSSQRRPDGTCAQCGSDQSETLKKEKLRKEFQNFAKKLEEVDPGLPLASPTPLPKKKERLAPRTTKSAQYKAPPVVIDELSENSLPVNSLPKWLFAAIPLGILFIIMLIWSCGPREYDVKVADVYFQHGVHVEKYQVVRDSGWNYPHHAFDVEFEGKRIHHHDRVEDGWEKDWYDDRVSDGQRCWSVSIPRKCRSNKNGFATCSGGGSKQKCETKYKTVRKWRKKTLYKDVPVYREWYSWKAWEWRHNRDVFATGHTLDVRWPSDAEVNLCGTCKTGEQERVGKTSSYTVKFEDKGDFWNYEPKGLVEFQRFPLGSMHHIKVTMGSVEVLPVK